MIRIIDDRCTACGLCLSTCPPGALRPAARRPDVIPEQCDQCLACIEVCPRDAVALDLAADRAAP